MEIGTQLNNRYTLGARVGHGAMGQVFRAVDAQTGQEVALKVLARDLTFDSEMLQRFRREGEALRQLRHPNIVGFIEMFPHEGQNIIAMEYVPGGSLHDLIDKGPLPVERARRMALEISDALTRAHHIGIIHRDLKPENVLLTADGSPKLTDFGVARLVDEGTRLTGTGTQVGTPFYMSPEAWEGQPLDGQADIWSLGVVFYEMLTGKLPFDGETVVAVMNKVLNAPLPDPRSQRPDAPPGLARIIGRMLCRNKAERYQTMREAAADIERGDIAAPPPRPAAPEPAPSPAAVQTRVSPARRAPASPPNRWRSAGLTLARLGLTAFIGLAVMGCIVLVGGELLLNNILEGLVTNIPFFPNEIGPGATFTFSRQDMESQLNRQAAQALPGSLRNLRLTFVPTDTLRVDAKIFGAESTLMLRAEAANGLPRVYLVSYNGVPLPLVGDMLLSGVNGGLAKVFAQGNLEMVSIEFSAEQLTLVLNGPGVEGQTRSNCISNQSFSDLFGAVHGAWGEPFETAQAKAYIENDMFVLRAIAPRTILTQYLNGCKFGDAQITVAAANPTPGSYAEYGLLFDRKDAQNYSAFLVSTTGFYAFEKVTGGKHALWPAGWTASPLIYTDSRMNHLGLWVQGLRASPSINGRGLPAYDVSAVSWGNVGLVVASGDNTNAEIDFRIFAVTLLNEAGPFPTALPDLPTPTGLATVNVRGALAPMTTPTPAPIQHGLTASLCNDGDVCVVDYLGHQKPLGLTKSYANIHSFISWSPDGQQLVFAACRKDELGRPRTCRDIYTADSTGLKVAEVYRNTLTDVQAPAWSGDAAWIAFIEDGQVVVIRPTGKNRLVLDASSPAVQLAWSPDSQHLAWAAKGAGGAESTLVWLIDRNGADRKLLFLDTTRRIERDQVQISWSPDGAAVLFTDESGQAWSFKADCAPVPNLGCDQTSRTSIEQIPQHWLPDFYPQWAGEKVSR